MLTAVVVDDEGEGGISVPVMFAVGSKLGQIASPLAGASSHGAHDESGSAEPSA